MMLIDLSCMFPGGNEEAQSIKIVESIMNETSKDRNSFSEQTYPIMTRASRFVHFPYHVAKLKFL